MAPFCIRRQKANDAFHRDGDLLPKSPSRGGTSQASAARAFSRPCTSAGRLGLLMQMEFMKSGVALCRMGHSLHLQA